MLISDRVNKIYEMVQRSYELADQGKFNESNDLYTRAYLLTENLISTNLTTYFTDEEYKFLHIILKTFENE